MQIGIINGPNLNLIGIRETNQYGSQSFDDFLKIIKKNYSQIKINYFQSNIEGELIDQLHHTGFSFDGIIFNPGGYTHTSIALSDAVAAIETPVIEVHISNIYSRESYRTKSLISKNCVGQISGFALMSYELALQYFILKNMSK